jgi:hypothetical protein
MMGFQRLSLQIHKKKKHRNKFCFFTFLHSHSFTNDHQQDGTSRHLRHVIEFLSATFSGRWIGRGRSVLWPPRSLDLTMRNLYVSQYVYIERILELNDLKARIREVAQLVTRGMLQCVGQEVECRFDMCTVTNGAHSKI